MSKFLTSAGWKATLKDSAKDKKTTITDNGLLKTLEKYESRKADDFKGRLDDLQKVFKLGLALSATCKKLSYQPAVEYLSTMMGNSVKTQEALSADMKAAAVSEDKKIMLRSLVNQAAMNVSTNAKANAALFGQQVEAACIALDAYAGPKLDSMDGGISGFDLLGPLVAVVTGGITSSLVVGAVDDLGRSLIKEMTKQTESQMRKQMQSIGKDSKDLEQAIRLLKVGAHDSALAISNVVANLIIKRCTQVINGVNSGNRLSDELTEFIEPFINQSPTAMDSLLEKRFGLPTPAKSKESYTRIYKSLVEKFEVARIKAITPSGEKMEWVVKGVPQSVQRNAEKLANQATKQREKETTQAEQK